MNSFDLEGFRARAAQKDIVSFDVFDTLLVRAATEPQIVFHLVEQVLGFRGFASVRASAETEARRIAGTEGREDTNLDEIYRLVIAQGGDGYAAARQHELEIEKLLLGPNPELASICTELKSAGKRIIAVSDMYHDSAFIRDLLRENGIAVDDIFISSETGKLKYSGNMFTHVLQDLGAPASSLLHIGDNWRADIKGARIAGVEAVLYPKISVQAGATPLIPAAQLSSDPEQLYPSLSTGQALVRWLEAGKPTDKRDLHWWIGYSMVGPLSRLFLEWLYRQAIRDNVEHLYFLRRDGELWQQMFEKLYPDISSDLLYGNRKLLQDASLEKLLDMDSFPTDHAIAFRISHGDSIDNIAHDLGFSPELQQVVAQELVAGGTWDAATLGERAKLFLGLIKKHEALWRRYASDTRSSLVCYFQQEGLRPERQDHIALVDIGWRLSSFRGLGSVIGFEPRAYFMGIARGAYFSRKLKGFLFDYGKPDSAYRMYKPHFIEVMETLFGGTESTALHLNAQGGIQLDAIDEDEQSRINAISAIYKGAMAFCNETSESIDIISSMSDEALSATARQLADQAINRPAPAFFEAISTLQFSPHAGRSLSTKKTLRVSWQQALTAAASIEHSPINDIEGKLLISWSQSYMKSLVPSGVYSIASRFRIRRITKLIERSGLFDSDWYTQQYPGITGRKISAVEHYVRYGVFEGFNPSKEFSSFRYLAENPDVARAGMNPLLHYILHGQFELRSQA